MLNTALTALQFQSTLSMRRATYLHLQVDALDCQISIHAPHEESDVVNMSDSTDKFIFQSTLSMRRATRLKILPSGLIGISIHALHEESDPGRAAHGLVGHLISIHALHEESDSISAATGRTPSISIHALHEESDLQIF